MKHKTIKFLSVLFVVFCSTLMQAQQDPQFTHYMYNMSVINPAYATDNGGVLNLGGFYRAQWVGIKGAPTTQSFFAHKPLSKKVEMGISVVKRLLPKFSPLSVVVPSQFGVFIFPLYTKLP